MAANALKERKKLLALRKLKMSQLFDDVDAHDSDRETSLHGHKDIMDAKHSVSPSYKFRPDPEPESSAKETSTSAASSILGSFSSIFTSADKAAETKQPVSKEPGKLPVPGQGPKGGTIAKPNVSSTTSTATYPSKKPPIQATTTDSENNNTSTKGVVKPKPKLSEILRQSVIKIKIDDESTAPGEAFLHVIEALATLGNTHYVFMQRVFDYMDLEAAGVSFHEDAVDLAYQIMDIQGNLLFLMEQHKITCSTFIFYSKKSFENIMYDIAGRKVLKFIGPLVVMSRMISKMLVTDAFDRQLGYVKPFGSKSNYSVYNAEGERLFLVVSNVYIPSSATVFTILYRGQKLGVIKYGWKHTFHDLPYIDYETAGLEVPPEMGEREKALLIGCMVLIEFTWYSPITKLKLSMLIVALLLILFAATLTVIPLIVDKNPDSPQTRSYYTADFQHGPN